MRETRENKRERRGIDRKGYEKGEVIILIIDFATQNGSLVIGVNTCYNDAIDPYYMKIVIYKREWEVCPFFLFLHFSFFVCFYPFFNYIYTFSSSRILSPLLSPLSPLSPLYLLYPLSLTPSPSHPLSPPSPPSPSPSPPLPSLNLISCCRE